MRIVLALLAVFAIFTTSCKTQPAPEAAPYCGILFSAVTGTAQGVALAFDCANVAAIAADLSAPIQKLNLCPKDGEKALGTIGDTVCPQAAEFVASVGVGALPTKWECKGGKPVGDLTAFVATQCKKYIKF